MELRRFLYCIAKMCWLIILMGIIGGGVAVILFDYSTEPLYAAQTTVYTLNKGNSVNSQGTIDYQNILISRQLINDYQDIIKSEKVIKMTENEIKNLNISMEELKKMISVNSQDESSIIVITATAGDPKIATLVSKAVAKSFISTIIEMTETNIVGIIDEAKEPTNPIPNPDTKIVILAILFGMGAAIVIIYIVDFFNTTIRFYEDIEHYSKLPVLGVIPKFQIK